MLTKTIKQNLIYILLLLILTVLTGCSNPQPNTNPDPDPLPVSEDTTSKELVVAASSSLTNAFTEIGKAFEEANNCTVTLSFGATGNLSEQIVNGAPFDVFAAANTSHVDALDTAGYLLSDTNQIFTVGRIGIATLKDSSNQAMTLDDLLKPEIKKIAIASPEFAPYGMAAKQALEQADLWEALEPKLVYGKNISETLTLVTTGNTEAGFIALSLKDDTVLDFNLIESKMHEPLSQSVAVVKNTPEEELARQFINFLMSTEGLEIMSQYGFSSPEE